LTSVICGRFVHYPRSLESWPMLSVGDLFIIPGVWKVGHCYVWASCSLSLELESWGRFVHYPRSLESWSLLCVGELFIIPGVWKVGGDLFIIPGVWKVGHCYVWAICSLPPGVWQVDQCNLWAICLLSQESGKLTSVTCWRYRSLRNY